jgi:hypothetical protein
MGPWFSEWKEVRDVCEDIINACNRTIDKNPTSPNINPMLSLGILTSLIGIGDMLHKMEILNGERKEAPISKTSTVSHGCGCSKQASESQPNQS